MAHSFTTFIWPDAWKEAKSAAPLEWTAVKFEAEDPLEVPEQRGVYAFVISVDGTIMPPHGCIMYFGQTGATSKRTLRDRYRDYLRERRKGPKRQLIKWLFDLWGNHLLFYYAPVPDEQISLEDIETSLNNAVIPSCSVNDFTAEVRGLIPVLRA